MRGTDRRFSTFNSSQKWPIEIGEFATLFALRNGPRGEEQTDFCGKMWH